ncbi:retrovirus-related pol polyprotein from transposon TNT 1-94 [Tanacetum coccineum]
MDEEMSLQMDEEELNKLNKVIVEEVTVMEEVIRRPFGTRIWVTFSNLNLSSRVEVPKELPKVSMVITSLKKLKHHLTGFDVVVKERTTPTAITEGSWGFEHTKACFRDEIIPFAVEQHRLESKTFEVKMNQVLNENERLLEQVISKDIVNILVNSSLNSDTLNVHECEKCLKLETELQKDFVEKEIYDNLFKSFTTLEKHSQSQEKDTVIKKLKERIKSLSGKMNEDKIKHELEEIETINIELDHRVSKLIAENEHLKQTYKQLYDSIKPAPLKDDLRKIKGKALVDNVVLKHAIDPEMLKIDVEYLNHRLLNNRITTPTEVPLRKPTVLENETPKPIVTLVYSRKPRKSKTNVPVSKSKVVQIVLWYLDSGCSKHMTGDRSQLTNFVNKFLGTVKFVNDHMAKILGYGDYRIGNVTISRVYYVEGLGHNLFSVRQFYDSNLEVAFRQHTCFIHNLKGADLLTGSRGNNLYTLSLGDMLASSPICLLSKASKTKSWLWHRCLSHLNFGAINHLARHSHVQGLPKLKFEKDHLCSAYAMGKSKKKPHKPKSEDTN